jgi:pimeloyl-ACP methyl ester carboxylesterase
LLQELRLEAFPALLGHSNGACIAHEYAEKYPTRVSRLILLSSQVHYGLASNEEYQKWIAKRMKDPGYAAAVPILQHRDEKFAQNTEKNKKKKKKKKKKTIRKCLTLVLERVQIWFNLMYCRTNV